MTERKITGNKTAEDIVRDYYKKLRDNPAGSDPPDPEPITQPPAVANLQNGFYQIDKARILSATTQEYRKFLRESGYGDLDSCSGMRFAKGVLKYDQAVRNAAIKANLYPTGNDGEYVVNISQSDARKLVEALGYKVPTVGLMYRLFVPYIKELVQQGNAEAQATLKEMTDTKAEWLEDLILDKTRLRIGTKEKILTLPDKNGSFDRADINEFGYPTAVKDQGEFYYWYPRDNEMAAVRGRNLRLNLSLDGGPSVEDVRLGVRQAKIF